ncbi:MAG: zinc ribbon domain-containing protein [Planctomycetaceae bacterium]|nr:zinc ribbon domain-containing protein [Planctomycetaceae bacterium]
MPLFEYRCADCRQDFELLIGVAQTAHCPRCGDTNVEKLFSETAAARAELPLAAGCPPGDAPCGPACCRLG